MNKFLTNNEDGSMYSVINEIINSQGNLLILGYGYIGNENTDKKGNPVKIKPKLKELFDNINKLLKVNVELRIEIHVGLFVSYDDFSLAYKSSFSSMSKDMKREHFFELYKKQIDTKFKLNQLAQFDFSDEVKDRIFLYGIPNFHAKYCLMVDYYNTFTPIAGVMGSSNLSASALSDKQRLELDLYMSGSEDNELLYSFSKKIKSIRDKNVCGKFASWSFDRKEVDIYNSEEMKDFITREAETFERWVVEIEQEADKQDKLDLENNFEENLYISSSSSEKIELNQSDLDQEIIYPCNTSNKAFKRN